MFYELIYTRCRNGVDILKNGATIIGEGYKVYACSPELYQEKGITDLNLLMNAAQAKQFYMDPHFSGREFMDDAYLFYAPDKGSNFLVNFHPVKFNPERQVNYSNRGGNFINQILIGDFSEHYAWEFFREKNIWNAQLQDEQYYYETEPKPLTSREIISMKKYNMFDKIHEFISDGRTELFKKALKFLITQYNLDPAERKYLVIYDADTESIELWIAAILCAFSPRMASGLPFATRMENFNRTNIYTVQNGLYQPSINFQDPNQKLRYRAMIIGTTPHEGQPPRPLQASPFVLLDGVKHEANFETEDFPEVKYFDAVTRFDDEHKNFCQNFLQSFNITSPIYEIPKLFQAFKALNVISSLKPEILAHHLQTLSNYEMFDTEFIRRIYTEIKLSAKDFMRQDFISSLNIIEWLKSCAKVLNDTEAENDLSAEIRNFTKFILVNLRGHLNEAKNILPRILAGEFRDDIARMIISPDTVKEVIAGDCGPDELLYFIENFYACAQISGLKISGKDILPITQRIIELCSQNDNYGSMQKLFESFAGSDRKNIKSAVNIIIKSSGVHGDFAVKAIVENAPEILSSFETVTQFCDQINAEGISSSASYVLSSAFDAAKKLDMLINFPEWISRCNYLDDDDKANLFAVLDDKIIIGKEKDMKFPRLIQKFRPENAACRKSANIMALNAIDNCEKLSQPLHEILRDYEKQGFPNITDGKFASRLSKIFIEQDLTFEELDYMFGLFTKRSTPPEIFNAVIHELVVNIKDFPEKWNEFLEFACEDKAVKQLAYDTILDVLYELSDAKKYLKLLGSRITRDNPKISEFIEKVLFEAEEDIMKRKSQGVIGRLFGKIFGGSED